MQLVPVDCDKHSKACLAAAAVDAGYALYYLPAAGPRRPIIVLLGRASFPAPWWMVRYMA